MINHNCDDEFTLSDPRSGDGLDQLELLLRVAGETKGFYPDYRDPRNPNATHNDVPSTYRQFKSLIKHLIDDHNYLLKDLEDRSGQQLFEIHNVFHKFYNDLFQEVRKGAKITAEELRKSEQIQGLRKHMLKYHGHHLAKHGLTNETLYHLPRLFVATWHALIKREENKTK